jgi:hypothetical protein
MTRVIVAVLVTLGVITAVPAHADVTPSSNRHLGSK